MHCIFCLQTSTSSNEHIFPAAIDGCVVIDRVCVACNSFIGTKIDAALTDYFPVKATRARLRLAGNSGKVPDLSMDILGGVGTLAGKPDHKIIARVNEKTKKFDTYFLPIISDVDLEDGTQAKSIHADIKDLRKLVERERKRAGRPPFSEDEMNE